VTFNGNKGVKRGVCGALKIALSLTSDDIHDILEKAGVIVTKGE